MYRPHIFWTLTLAGGERSDLRHGRFIPRKFLANLGICHEDVRGIECIDTYILDQNTRRR
jgi:hypothetical protein